ncbi:hypothetical protein Dimus_016150, partial [Dionaea muscipula]
IMWAEAMGKLKGMDSLNRDRLWPQFVQGFKDLSQRLKYRFDVSSSSSLQIEFYGDFDGSFHKSLDLTMDLSLALLGVRSDRWSACVEDGKIKVLNVETVPSEFKVSGAGNMRHFIVEACIARNLIDTSAYFWPGYVSGRIDKNSEIVSPEVPGWLSFMKGSQLTSSMIKVMVATPASRTCKDNHNKAFADCSIPQEMSNAEINVALEALNEEDAYGTHLGSEAYRSNHTTGHQQSS